MTLDGSLKPARAQSARLRSGPPWHISLTLDRLGTDYVCRIFRGEPGASAVAHARWHAGRASTTVSGSRSEQQIALDAAHRLCKAARRGVTCTVGLQLGRHTADEVQSIARASCKLSAAMQRRLEQRRIRTALEDPNGLLSRLRAHPGDDLERRIDDLLATPLEDLLSRHRNAIAQAHAARFARRVLVFAPLYLSNACLNDCSYCGFRRSKRIERIKLSAQQALAEAHCLVQQGHRTLDLVAGEIPTDAFIDYVCDVCARILECSPIRRINLNVGALSDEQYGRLRSAGAEAYHLYQETYDPDVYLNVHRNGPKRDMANRLHGARRALRAGFDGIGLGILLGLAPVASDLACLARHAHVLMQEFPRARLGFSLPRIQHAGQEPGLIDAAWLDDTTFMKAFLFLRLEFPAAHLTLTTRESATMRDALLPLGVTKVSAGVSTSPGGYGAAERRGARQFCLRDERSLEDVADCIRNAGLVPTFG